MSGKTTLWPGLTCLLLILAFNISALAQPANDDCGSAKHLDVSSGAFCSEVGVETNLNATPSANPIPSCFADAQQDVWYTFEAPSAQVDILAFAPILSSLFFPSLALYSGDCNGLTEIGCAADITANGNQTLSVNTLVPGQTYYIRLTSVLPGDFQLCITTKDAEDAVSGDCPTANFICNKEPRFIPFVSGPGNDPFEWDGVPCLAGGFSGEDNSSWFVFTAATNGTLEFMLIPENPDDDLDFMVYHLPGGPDDCAGRILERCMVAGDFFPTSGCYGPTGLNATATDFSQPPGCLPGDDNFLQYMDLVAGETYALSVNNFTSTGNGFTIQWGGTAEFTGPNVDLKSDDADNVICLGEEIQFVDTITSVFNGTIDSWKWSYGIGSTPFSDTTTGPHPVKYLVAGEKTVKLTMVTSDGCIIKKTLDVQVDSCCALLAGVNILPDCLPDTTCQQAVATVENGVEPFQYTWSTGSTDTIISQLYKGDYFLIVQDAFGCVDTVNFKIDREKIFGIPNAFTPNGDQANDVFKPVNIGTGAVVEQIQVWNRWGNVVYDGPNGWDGKLGNEQAPSDVYIYKVKIKWLDGHEEIKHGEVTLLR